MDSTSLHLARSRARSAQASRPEKQLQVNGWMAAGMDESVKGRKERKEGINVPICTNVPCTLVCKYTSMYVGMHAGMHVSLKSCIHVSPYEYVHV